MFKIAICDDDVNYRTLIRNIISDDNTVGKNVLFFEYPSGESLLADVHQMHNLLFLDIQMSGLNGNETAKAFRKINKGAVLIFCTNYQYPTTESFKVQPYRYVMKDINNQMLIEEMPDIIRKMESRSEIQYLNITEDGRLSRISIKHILYISVIKRGSAVHYYTDEGTKEVYCRENVRDLYNQLSEKGFEYAHNSYIVNMSNIIHVNKNIITLNDNTELNISRSKQRDFDNSFSAFLCMRYKRK